MRASETRRARGRAAGAAALLACAVALVGWSANGALASALDQGSGSQGRLAAPVASDAAGGEEGAKDGFARFSAPPDDDGASGEGDAAAADGEDGEEAASDEAVAVSADEVPAVKVTVGPWFARFDAGAVDRAPLAAEDAPSNKAAAGAGLATSLFAVVAVMCTAAGAACFILAGSVAPRPVPRGGRAKASSATVRKPVVTRRKEA